MAYATASDVTTALGADEALRGADRNFDQVEDAGVVVGALADASAEIDLYIGKVVKLPLAEPYPVSLRRFAVDIAVYRMAPGVSGYTKEKRQRYEDCIAQLEKIAAGKIGIGLGPDGEDPGVVGERAYHGAAPREFTREGMGSGGVF